MHCFEEGWKGWWWLHSGAWYGGKPRQLETLSSVSLSASSIQPTIPLLTCELGLGHVDSHLQQ